MCRKITVILYFVIDHHDLKSFLKMCLHKFHLKHKFYLTSCAEKS